jgi:hypothetical protein
MQGWLQPALRAVGGLSPPCIHINAEVGSCFPTDPKCFANGGGGPNLRR